MTFLQLPDINFLFTGDVGKQGLRCAVDYLYKTSPILDYKVTHLQLPHHGSRKNIDPDIVRDINCNNYIISSPIDGESEGHPSARLVNKILEINPQARIHKTSGSNFIYHLGDLGINARHVSPMNKFDEIED